MPRITNDLHNALVEISKHGKCHACQIVFHKLELMGLIMFEFGGVWTITEDGINYLTQVMPIELNPNFDRKLK